MITQLTKMIENTRIKYRLMKLTKINYIFIIIKENKKTFILLTKGDTICPKT